MSSPINSEKTSASTVAKPIAGKRIENLDINKMKISGVSKKFLGAPVLGWTSPKSLVNSINTKSILQQNGVSALNLIRDSFTKIAESEKASAQLKRFASNCREYSKKKNFYENFHNLYTARQKQEHDRLLKSQANHLSAKSINSATRLTSRAIDVVTGEAMNNLDEPHGSSSGGGSRGDDEDDEDDDDDDDMESENEGTEVEEPVKEDRQDVMGPSREMNFAPNKPKLTSTMIENMKNSVGIAISGLYLSEMPQDLTAVLEKNLNDQSALKMLNSFPSVLIALRQLLDDTADNATFPVDVWKYQAESQDWPSEEQGFYSVAALVLTDFWGLFKRQNFNRAHERSFWVDYVTPLFKHFPLLHSSVVFSWCENMVHSHNKSQMVPGVWNNSTEKFFADGIARTSGFEILLMESSGPYDTEYIDHSIGDTMKLIKMMSCSLRDEVQKYQDASFETAKNLSVYGIQCIRDRLTLIKTSMRNHHQFQVIELRSAAIPVTWDSKSNLLLCFELLATINDEIKNQEQVLGLLRRQNNRLVQVDQASTVRAAFSNFRTSQ